MIRCRNDDTTYKNSTRKDFTIVNCTGDGVMFLYMDESIKHTFIKVSTVKLICIQV